MHIKIIHLVDSAEKINFGIWNAALFSADYLKTKYSISIVLWVCNDKPNDSSVFSVPVVYLGKTSLTEHLDFKQHNITPENTIFVSHGCWLNSTRLGYAMSRRGFKWVYTPHGMLEPWSMNHKKWKKMIYFHLFEKRWVRNAEVIRAVSEREKKNLQLIFNRSVELIENGVSIPEYQNKPKDSIVFLFMARLHYKKGVLPLVKAWNKCMKDSVFRLLIAGPDEGEGEKIKSYLSDTVQYIGPVYGEDKKKILQLSNYYILPSYSEGFPTSVVEAMSYGLIPVISEGCNFPMVFEKELGYKIDPDEDSISKQLNALKEIPFNSFLSYQNYLFVKEHNSEEYLGEKYNKLYQHLITNSMIA